VSLDGARQRDQDSRVDVWGWGATWTERRDLQGVDALAQPGGHHLTHGGQSPASGRPDASARTVSGQLKSQGQGDGLLVVEQQGREPGTGVQTVAAVRALGGGDGVAERAEPVDVAPDGAGTDVQVPLTRSMMLAVADRT
jgi:hypothetical protein